MAPPAIVVLLGLLLVDLVAFLCGYALVGLAGLAVVALYLRHCRQNLPAPECPVMVSSPVMDVIKQRRSWRSYGKEPSEEELEALRQFAAREDVAVGPIAHTRVTIVIIRQTGMNDRRKLGTYGFIQGAKCFIVGVLRKGQSIEDFGAVFERVVLQATRLGLCTCWLGGTYSGASFTEAAAAEGVSFAAGDQVFCVSPLGHPANDTNLLLSLIIPPSARTPEGRTFRKPVTSLFFEADGTPLNLASLTAPYAEAVEAVRAAPSASNMQPWRLVRSLAGNGWHFFGVPGRSKYAEFALNDCGIAACHWEQVMAEHGARGKWVVMPIAEIRRPPQRPGEPEAVYHFSWVSC